MFQNVFPLECDLLHVLTMGRRNLMHSVVCLHMLKSLRQIRGNVSYQTILISETSLITNLFYIYFVVYQLLLQLKWTRRENQSVHEKRNFFKLGG